MLASICFCAAALGGRWRRAREALSEKESETLAKLGVRVGPDQDVSRLKAQMKRIDMVALTLSPFTDGRSFSQARILREQLGFQGEIRASGDFLRDQMY